MPMDTQRCVDKCFEFISRLSPDEQIYLDVALREAQLMQLVRQVAAGNIEIDEDGEDE